MIIRLDNKNKTIIGGLLVRIIILIVIACFAKSISAYGFLGNTPAYDDFRYEQGAYLYSQQADKIIDVGTFTRIFDSFGDWTGHHLMRPLTEGYLWYWIVCILVYITKWRWSIRLLNILFSVATINCIYNIAYYCFSEQSANIAAKLWAYLPYTVIFSCFSYKDNLVAYFIFYLFFKFVQAKNGNGFEKKDLFKIVLISVIFSLTRSGVSEIILFLCLLYFFWDEIKGRMQFKYFILFIVFIFAVVIAAVALSEYLSFKFGVYIFDYSYDEGIGMGAYIKINGLKDIWKLPLSYLYAIMQPIGTSIKINTWGGLISRLNVIMSPIAIYSVMGIFFVKKEEKVMPFLLLCCYLMSVITSALIFRQLFCFLPIPLLFASHYIANADRKNFSVVTIVAAAYMIAVFLLIFLR